MKIKLFVTEELRECKVPNTYADNEICIEDNTGFIFTATFENAEEILMKLINKGKIIKDVYSVEIHRGRKYFRNIDYIMGNLK